MAADPSADAELSLLDTVIERLAFSDDDKLQTAIATYLPPVLMKLESPHQATQAKVLEVLTHINNRLAANKACPLPLETLMTIYKSDQGVSASTKNMALIYIDMGLGRVPPAEAAAVLPDLMVGLGDRPKAQRDGLLVLVTKFLSLVALPPEVADRQAMFPYDPETDAVLPFMLDVMFLHSAHGEVATIPLGLSAAAYAKFAGKPHFMKNNLRETKLAILRFLTSEIFPSNAIIPHLIVGKADTFSSVADLAEGALKRLPNVDYDDPVLLRQLYVLAFGNRAELGADANPDDRRTPCSTEVKSGVLSFCGRSRLAANTFPEAISLVRMSLFGLDVTHRFRSEGMEFLLWVLRHASDDSMLDHGRLISDELRQFLRETRGHDDAVQLRGTAYGAVGEICRRCPVLFHDDTEIVRTFFARLKDEIPAARGAIQQALTFLCSAFVGSQDPEIERIVTAYMSPKQPAEARYAALYYANRVFPFTHSPTRHLALMGTDDGDHKVSAEARRGLRPYRYEPKELNTVADNRVPYPDFADMALYVGFTLSDVIVAPDDSRADLGFSSAVHLRLARFLGACFQSSAAQSAMTQSQYLASLCPNDAIAPGGLVDVYVILLERGLLAAGEMKELSRACTERLHRLVALSPTLFTRRYGTRMAWLQQAVDCNDFETQKHAARLLGALTRGGDFATTALALTTDFLARVSGTSARLESRFGAAIAAGYTVGGCIANGVDIPEDLVRTTASALRDLLGEAQPVLQVAAADALGEVARHRPLTFDGEASDDDQRGSLVARLKKIATTAHNNAAVDAAVRALGCVAVGERGSDLHGTIVDLLLGMATIKQLDIQFTIGESLVCAAAGWVPSTWASEKGFNDAVNVSVAAEAATAAAAQANAEVAAAAAAAADADASTSEADVGTEAGDGDGQEEGADGADEEEEEEGAVATSGEVVEISAEQAARNAELATEEEPFRTIWTAVTELMRRGSLLGRQASCIWLLCLQRFAADHSVMVAELMETQRVFGLLLADSNSFTQECASRGLGMVYEVAPPSVQEDMLRLLVKTLSKGKSNVSVDEDQPLFEGEQVGGSGGLMTYKELCSIASDMNKPDMIYHFMSIASHNAIWNSRKGAAFGFSSIAKFARDDLKAYLPTLVPRLYRYQFDPNVGVHEAMKSIWESVVEDPDATVEEYFDIIIDDLLTSMGARQWRVRESAAIALAALVPGRDMDQLQPYLERAWVMAFRALDDIKETVRNAGLLATKALGSLSVKICSYADTHNKAASQAAIDILVPYLLTKGIINDADKVRRYSLSLLKKLVKGAGPMIRPHVGDIVGTLLEAMSTLEPQTFNYAQFHAERAGVSREDFESIRISLTKDSVIMEVIDELRVHTDEAVLESLVPQLIHAIRHGIALPTKIGASKVLVSLCHENIEGVRPFASKLLKALRASLMDPSPSVRKAYAQAIAWVCKVAKKKPVRKVIEDMSHLYLNDKTEAEERLTTGHVLNAMTRYSQAQLKNYAVDALPLAFLASHDSDERTAEVWLFVWEQNTPGMTGGCRLYVDEILGLVVKTMHSLSWEHKRQGAAALNTLASKGGAACLTPDHLRAIFPEIKEALSGRTWSGKETVVEALVTLFIETGDVWAAEVGGDEGLDFETVVGLVLSQAVKKKDLKFRRACLSQLTRILEHEEGSGRIWGRVESLLFELGVEVAAGVMDEGERSTKPLKLVIQAEAIKGIGLAFPIAANDQGEAWASVIDLVGSQLQYNVWNVKTSLLSMLKAVAGRLDARHIDPEHAELLSTVILGCLDDTKYNSVRRGAIDALDALLSLHSADTPCFGAQLGAIKARVAAAATTDADANVAYHARQLKVKVDALEAL